jgi:hypothetical protein
MKGKFTSKFKLCLCADKIKNLDEIENPRFSKVLIPEALNFGGIRTYRKLTIFCSLNFRGNSK